MRWIFIFLMLFSLSAKAKDEVFCPNLYSNVKINNLINDNRLKYDFSKSVKEITAMSKRKIADDEMILGLFHHDVMGKYSVLVDFDQKDGCITGINLTMDMDFNPTIYVANEYKKETKEYDYILWHEKEHAKITIENNKMYLDALKKEMERYISGLKVPRAWTNAELSKREIEIADLVKTTAIKSVEKLNIFIEKLQNEFDEKEYKQNNLKWHM